MSHYKTGHKQPRFRYSVLARCVAWANISVQVLFPLAVTFTPVMAARAQHAVQPRLSMGNTTVTADNNVEKNVASFAANAGTFLSSQPDSDATRNFITGMATAKANQEIQEWLGKYGTARVKLNVDKDFSLKDSSLEMLYPIYDTPTNMLFTQGAIHRTDDRTQSNIGFGWRHFSGNDWMAGVNTFIDHDLSRSHTRIGVGAEYWRDYLKLSANGYIRASGWKKSPDIEDYQERPANGWDIRAEGYLPAWPQLGASLMYEQYYGDEVGLFGKDKRQKDPHAISAEVTYTPVPLLTLSAGHKQGKSGENDTRFGLEVNYRIGEPLAKQLDTDSIRERRVLAGSRYDLVERNNNIVLEYRKSEVIRIALPERIEGKGGQTLSLGLVVSKATHGLKNVQWEAPSLLAEGGKITGQGSQWQVTLPAYRPGKDNYYAISAVAYDNKGNASKRVQTEVVITGAGMSADRTALTLDGQSRIQMLANGNEQRPLVLSLRDAEGQPVTGMKDQIKTELAFKPAGNIVTRSLKATKSQAKPTLGEFTETEAGVYQSVFTTGTQSGEATITVSVDGMSKTVTAELRATMMDVANSTLSANEPSGDVVADGQQAYTLTAVDSEGNPVTGEASRLRFVPQDTNGVTVGAISEIKPGVYSATVSSTRAGNVVVRAFSEQYQLGTLQQTLKFVAGPLDAAHSSITLNPDKPVVGGTVTAIWTAKDAYDNPVTSLTPEAPSLAGAAAVGSTASGWTNNGDGTWTAQITLGSTAGELEVMPKLNGQDAAANAAKVTVVADALSSNQSKVSVAEDHVKAGESTTVTLIAKDAHGNTISGLSLSASLTGTASEGATVSSWTEKGDCSYVATLTTGGKTGELRVMPLFNGQPAATEAAQLTVIAGEMSSANSTLVADNKAPTVKMTTELTFTVKDAYGNPVTGLKPDAPVFSGAASTGSERPSAGNWTEKGNGVYVATLTLGSAAGQLSVMPRVNGQNAVAQPLVLNVAGDASKAEIRDMTVKVNNQLANGQSANQITLTVVDSYGNPLQGQEVTLTLPQGVTSKTGNTVTTNAAGKVDIELMSTVAGEHSITASVNNAQKTVTVKFKADFSTGQATLEVDGSTPKVANDNDAFTLTATVKDQYGNLLPGAVVVFNLPRGVKPLADGNIMVNADKEGKAELKVVSVTAGTYEITASAGNDQPSNAQSVTFVADKTTATISSIEVIGNRAVADGKTKQTYKVTVTDANNNLLKDSDVTLTASSENLVLDPKGTAKTNEQGQAVFTGSTTIAATYTLTAKVEQANGQVSTKTAESKFVADDKNAVLAASPERVDSLVADGKTTATMTVTLMAGVNPVGGSMWVDIEAPEGVTEKDYQFLPSKADHFSGGKITRTFSTSKPGVYTFTFNALTYGGYEMTPVKVTINAVAAETENGEEEMP
ncbi:TPA: intimin-like adhesin FdeC [Escherichia coli]|uniref:inverse autotransporter adhesin FdeC n=1 Tax=Escherichia coli TaxID=562 RepID=UPI00107B2AB3|nr:inverse autotransporter adhesin FdeC [Escherichia coli]EFH7909743.1 intimin-like adhesin FdeC [Escherichia coli O157:H7]EEC7719221.1 intimin-like adhesin FdeC [Escherichia coli]EEQ4843424.1 intimin-like adhesin FdeC [Escherichia coli]EEU2237396.1 intimin-like adhesin FdeC [Escherichia coli]EFC1442818.1 intimin-like adhesin FdeC [Escherichia coli]